MSDWIHVNDSLVKEFKFNSFEDAMQFMQNAAIEISRINHHPEWTNVYNRVQVKLTTHDAGNVVTDKDLELSKILDTVFERMVLLF